MNVCDTETINRRGFGNACWVGVFDGVKLREIEFPANFDAIFDFLANDQKSSDYFLWNMAFDARALIHPRFFPKSARLHIERLGIFDESFISGKYAVKMIPKKLVEIKRGNQTVRLLDLKQFFGGSLKVASEKYLPKAEQKKEIPKSWYNEIDECLKDQRRGRILEYAHGDLRSSHALLKILEDQLRAADLMPKRLISSAAIARKIFGPRLKKQKPSDAINRRFELGFFGGMISCPEIGRVGKCTLLDLGSAYPSVMAELLPLENGVTYTLGRDTWAGIKSRRPDYGIYRIQAMIPARCSWGPLAVRLDTGGVIYPVGRVETDCGLDALETLAENKIPFEIIEGLEYHCTARKPLFPEIPRLYALRKDPRISMAIKLGLNSGYGICAERRDEWAEAASGARAGRFFVTKTDIYGSLTNFVYASKITEKIRMRVWKILNQFGERAIFAATDGILIKGVPEIPAPGGLGQWGISGEYAGGVVLGSGRYQLHGKNPVSHLRGFPDAEKNFEVLKKCRKKFAEIKTLESGTLREWANDFGEGDLNVLETLPRKLELGDKKHYWPELPARISDCWKKSYRAKPIIGR